VKGILLILAWAVVCQIGYGANSVQSKVDSLKQELTRTKDKGEIVNCYNELARQFFAQPDSCMHYSDKLIRAAQELNRHEFVGLGHHYKGIMLYNQYNMAGSIENYFKALDAYKLNNDSTRIALIYTSIGNVYEKLGDNERALDNHRLSEKWYGNDINGLAYLYHNIAAVYKHLESYDSATYYYNKSIKLKTSLNDQSGIAVTYNNLGEMHKITGNVAKAKDLFRDAIRIKREHSSPHSLAVSLGNLGVLLIQEDSVKQGIQLCKEAEAIYKAEGIVEDDKDICECLFLGFQKQGKDHLALDYLIRLNAAKELLFSEDKTRDLARQESNYTYQKKSYQDSVEQAKINEVKLAKEKAQKEQAESANLRNKIILYFVLAIVAVILFFVYMVVKSLRLVREQKAKVDEAYEELEEKNREILDSITYAKRIQSAILPPNKLVKAYLNNSFILYKPKDIVAGDFYWMEAIDHPVTMQAHADTLPKQGGEHLVLFAAADCTGHGVPGAMVSVICNNGLNRSVREHGLIDPGKILDKTREIVISEFEKSEDEVKDGMDIALCSLSGGEGLSTQTLKYAGANNPLWIIRKGSDAIEEIKADKQPIGQYAAPLPYTTHELQLNPGDSFYIFSDGFADQFGGNKGKKFKAANFKKLLLSVQNEPIDRQKELIDDAFENWMGDLEQLDDVCVIGVKI
jgi:serine phosphatase RsbU (regulator of sigma subunit)